jgi:DNA-directed RNA polymerase subunit RPC12/RpoP
MDNENYKYQGVGLGKSEKYQGQKKFNEYIKVYHFSAYSDLQLLEDLIFYEIAQERMKINIEDKKKALDKRNKELPEKDQKEYTVPTYIHTALNSNLEQILILKEKLGLLSKQDSNDGFNYIQTLKEKFAKWREENQGSRTIVCPFCSKIVLLKIRSDIWETQQHPFYKDKTLYNEHLINMYLANKITAEDVAKVLGTSPKYTEWLIEKFQQRKSKENEK